MKKFRKLYSGLLLLIQYPFYPISFLFYRNKNRWIFGSYGIYNDNSRYLFEYCNKHCPEIRAIWIGKNRYSILPIIKDGYEAYTKYSLKGLYYQLTSKVYIYSSYVNNINFFTSGNTLLVNLWHGIPLKKIEFDINTLPLSKYFKNATFITKILYPQYHKKPDLLLSPGEFVYNYSFKTAFKLPKENIIFANYPRVNNLINRKNVNKEFYFLYTPTWRDDDHDFLCNKLELLEKINEFCNKRKCKFLLKLHANTNMNNAEIGNLNRIEIVNNKTDPNEVLSKADCLITDYSSIYFDYLYLNRPIIFFTYDEDSYSKNRELYNLPENIRPGPIVREDDALLSLFKNILDGKDDFKIARNNIKKLFSSSENDDFIIQRIREKLTN
ncbi:hypothetical protein EAE91_05660 [Photorhabdus noenieputensis]|uniref:CDP-glycerol glycerophosphotransferase family protein n=1 Tax=Photorhabdus noenieputensis TaxID=1208607 RepID=UPI001BD2E8DE|nr:CDP-glycerol glycerophosphotransferase family protein [Photorhabdus noenieputensis]MBS9436682.1 hypothetical protein [Photorhabdus noenieputensis]MCK3669458.1 CDP-glycerol glycerophosphotransferase family protein [Photorhabdus noenieputensis]